MSDGITDMYREEERFNSLTTEKKKKVLENTVDFWKKRLLDEPTCKFYMQMYEDNVRKLHLLQGKK